MRKYFNKYTISVFILFIIQSLNVAWCISNPNIDNIATYIGLFGDGFVFANLINVFTNCK